MKENEEVKKQINEKLYDLEKKLDTEENKKGLKSLIGVIITIACTFGILGIISFSLPIQFALSLGIIGSISAIKAKCYNDTKRLKIERYNKEYEHLNRVEEYGIEENAKIQEKRKDRIDSITPEIEERTEALENSDNYGKATTLFAVLGAVLTATYMPWVAIPAVIAEMASISFAMESLGENEKLQKLLNRKDNLQNDIDIADTIASTKVATPEPEKKSTLPPLRRVANPRREKAISDYINSLGAAEDTTGPKTYTK